MAKAWCAGCFGSHASAPFISPHPDVSALLPTAWSSKKCLLAAAKLPSEMTILSVTSDGVLCHNNRPARAGKYRPPKIQILLTKCDLVKRIDLARRVAFVRQQLEEVIRGQQACKMKDMRTARSARDSCEKQVGSCTWMKVQKFQGNLFGRRCGVASARDRKTEVQRSTSFSSDHGTSFTDQGGRISMRGFCSLRFFLGRDRAPPPRLSHVHTACCLCPLLRSGVSAANEPVNDDGQRVERGRDRGAAERARRPGSQAGSTHHRN